MAEFMTMMLERSTSLWKDCSFFTSVSSMIESVSRQFFLKICILALKYFLGEIYVHCVCEKFERFGQAADVGISIGQASFPRVIFLTISSDDLHIIWRSPGGWQPIWAKLASRPAQGGGAGDRKPSELKLFSYTKLLKICECCLRLRLHIRLRLRLRLNCQKGHFQLCTALTTLKSKVNSISEWVTMSLIDKLSSPGQLKNLYLCHSLLRISVFDNHLALFSVMHKFFC